MALELRCVPAPTSCVGLTRVSIFFVGYDARQRGSARCPLQEFAARRLHGRSLLAMALLNAGPDAAACAAYTNRDAPGAAASRRRPFPLRHCGGRDARAPAAASRRRPFW